MAAAAWPVCTICYEDLRPLSDQHLHCLPACGHVFHALCLEQWLEYCPGGKKKLTCPICKQPCGAACPPTRLFFQSTGACPSRPAPPRGKERMVARWREQVTKAEATREAARREKECVQQILNSKTEELSRKTSKCIRLQEKSLVLAKELAALKLYEEEIIKLASLGNHGNPENAIDILTRSLALRNKSYKELMVQCNLLGRSESRSQQRFDKAKELIKKLRARVQDLEKELEEKKWFDQGLEDVDIMKRYILKIQQLEGDLMRQKFSTTCINGLHDQFTMDKDLLLDDLGSVCELGTPDASKMAGLFASAAVKWALDKLSSLLPPTLTSPKAAAAASSNVQGELENLRMLERTMRRIHATLHDAEQHWNIREESAKLRLQELKDLAYDAEDVVEEYEYEVNRFKVEAFERLVAAVHGVAGKGSKRKRLEVIN
ncbi:hypothetical protein ABZP36_009372 [Zizania latifolia]